MVEAIQQPNQGRQGGGRSIKEIGNIKVFMNQKLGKGASATVYKGLYYPLGRKKMESSSSTVNPEAQARKAAVKVINSNLIRQQNLQNFLNNELNLLNRMRHRNIIEFLGFERTKNSFYMVFELCEGGDFQ